MTGTQPVTALPEIQRTISKGMDLFKAGRCDFFAVADYRRDSELWRRTVLLIDRMVADIRVEEERWRLGRD